MVKADDPERRREMRTFTAVMSVLFLLVMVYVWQHFSAIEVGYKIEAQKQQVEQMREQNRQLRLSEAQLTIRDGSTGLRSSLGWMRRSRARWCGRMVAMRMLRCWRRRERRRCRSSSV